MRIGGTGLTPNVAVVSLGRSPPLSWCRESVQQHHIAWGGGGWRGAMLSPVAGDEAAAGRVTLTCLAFNTAQIYLSRSGERLAAKGIRKLRRHYSRPLGRSPAVIYIDRSYAVLSLEKLLAITGYPAAKSLRPFATSRSPP